jgi:DNA-binding MarR family transcriptional regulator
METPSKAQASRPVHLFLSNDLVKAVGLVEAAILADLNYWFIQGKNPWRTYQNWAEWLGVSVKTIGKHIKSLTEKSFLNKERTRLSGGGLGAYKYSKSTHENSKFAYQTYKDIFNNKHSSNDLGSIDQDYVNNPKFQLVQLDSISALGDLTLAYIINSLAWFAASLETYRIEYSSISSLATRLNIRRNTLTRCLDKLERNKALVMTSEGWKIQIELLNEGKKVQEDFFIWLSGVQEKRLHAFVQGFN